MPTSGRTLVRAARAVLVTIAVAAAAPAPVRADGCTLPGGAWREIRSTHFTIELQGATDPNKAVAVLEELRAAVIAALISEPVEIPGRVRVVVLESERSLDDFVPFEPKLFDNEPRASIRGLFWVSSLREPTILVSARALEDMPEVVAHELAHHVSFHLFPRQPWWLREGLAQFMESTAKPDAAGRRWAGGHSLSSGEVAGSVKLTPTADLFSGGGGMFDHPYATAWVLYRFLWNERSSQLTKYLNALSDGSAPDEAWRVAFPEWDSGPKLRALDDALARYQKRGWGARWQIATPKADVAFTAGPGSTSELHMILLDRQVAVANKLIAARVARSAAEEALREDPSNPVAIASLLADKGSAAVVRALRSSVAARPKDGRAWYLLARTTDDAKERQDALRRAVELWPDGALAHAALAAELARTGRPRDAVHEVNLALELAPWDATIIGLLGRVALDLGKCREALALAQRAVDVGERGSGTGPDDADLAALRKQLESAQGRCAPRQPDPPPAAAVSPGK